MFRKLPRIDAVFVPGGDPGHTRPKFLMALLEKQADNLHRYPSQGPDVGLAAELLAQNGSTSSSHSCKPSRPG